MNAATPFPERVMRDLPYQEMATLTVGGTTLFGTSLDFSLNSLFDPNQSGTGHQPNGFDTLATQYYRYKVTHVDVEIECQTAGTRYMWLGALVVASGDTTTIATKSLNLMMEKPNFYSQYIDYYHGAKFRKSWALAELLGVSPAQLEADSNVYSAVVSANPSAMPWIRISIASTDSDDNTSKADVVVRINYRTVFWNRISSTQS